MHSNSLEVVEEGEGEGRAGGGVENKQEEVEETKKSDPWSFSWLLLQSGLHPSPDGSGLLLC